MAGLRLININSRFRVLLISLFLFGWCLSSTASADTPDTLFDLYSLNAEATGEVDNDMIKAQLVVEGESRDSASLANNINATMEWALNILKKYPDIKVKTLNYSTWPKYERKQNRIIGWHASQAVQIESENFEVTRKAIQSLQEKLQIRNMHMVPKPDTRTQREDELISDALDRFKDRALTVQHNMGAADYRIVNVSISTNQNMNHQPRMRDLAMTADESTAPAIAAGSSQVTVRVNGSIQLQ